MENITLAIKNDECAILFQVAREISREDYQKEYLDALNYILERIREKCADIKKDDEDFLFYILPLRSKLKMEDAKTEEDFHDEGVESLLLAIYTAKDVIGGDETANITISLINTFPFIAERISNHLEKRYM